MKILSLDLSTKSSGWAIFEDKKLINHGCITSSSTDLIKRIHKMTDEIKQILINNRLWSRQSKNSQSIDVASGGSSFPYSW